MPRARPWASVGLAAKAAETARERGREQAAQRPVQGPSERQAQQRPAQQRPAAQQRSTPAISRRKQERPSGAARGANHSTPPDKGPSRTAETPRSARRSANNCPRTCRGIPRAEPWKSAPDCQRQAYRPPWRSSPVASVLLPSTQLRAAGRVQRRRRFPAAEVVAAAVVD